MNSRIADTYHLSSLRLWVLALPTDDFASEQDRRESRLPVKDLL